MLAQQYFQRTTIYNNKTLLIHYNKFVQINFLPHICTAMNKPFQINQWWWHTNSSGVL